MVRASNDGRKPWPGPIDKDKDDLTTYLTDITDSIGWQWDDPSAAAAIAERCHPWLIELHAITAAHSELINGGFCQFLENSYGELAEDAVSGLKTFELYDLHDLFNEALFRFPRPISKCRLERINMLSEYFGEKKRIFSSIDEFFEIELRDYPSICEMAASYFDPFEERYYKMIKLSGDDLWGRLGLEVPLCDFIERHKEIFFKLDHSD